MPVNMNPKKRSKPQEPDKSDQKAEKAEEPTDSTPAPTKNLDEPTEADLAHTEWEKMWEETEVIDMDKW